MPSLDQEESLQEWFSGVCEGLTNTHSALLITKHASGYKPEAFWPRKPSLLEELSVIAEQSLDESQAIVVDLALVTKKSCFGVSFLIEDDVEVTYVIVFAVLVDDEQALKPILHYIKSSSIWLRYQKLAKVQRKASQQQYYLAATIDFYSKVLAQDEYSDACLRLVSELALEFNCTLVSMGTLEKDSIRMQHLSNSAQVSKHMNLTRHIEAAMDEAFDQRQVVLYPYKSSSTDDKKIQCLVTFAHQVLSKDLGESLLTIPLLHDDECLGVVLLQRDISQPFSLENAEYLESLLRLATLSLYEKKLNSRALFLKVSDSAKQQLHRLFGQGFLGRKLFAIATTIVLLLLTFLKGEYRLSTDATLIADQQRIIVAPFDGFISSAPVRAGDMIEEQDLVFQLDVKELLLEKVRSQSQKSKFQRQYFDAMAQGDRASANIFDAQIQQAEAQLDLVDSKIERSSQRSPFKGVILSGDLSQRFGGSVKQGEILFEVSPLNAYRIKLHVPEDRISDIEIGQTGTLYLAALPQQSFNFSLIKITPFTESKEGSSYFVVEANLLHIERYLRPGMEGIGKITIDQRNLLSIWTRELREVVNMIFWRWWG